jgi:hypothetical protein
MADGKRKDWRELCAAVALEPDPEKVVSLVHQILQAFEERDREIKFVSGPEQYCGQS